MKTLDLHDGTKMPTVGLGTWKPQGDDVYNAVRYALSAGYRHLDCAAIYGNEDVIGRALADAFAAGDAQRDDLWITSKLWNTEHAADDVRPALEKTLSRLGLEYLDLYLMHWPVALTKGVTFPQKTEDFISLSDLPLATTWNAMAATKEAGLTRQIGVSNFSAKKTRDLRDTTGVLPAVNQVEMHPYLAQSDLLAASNEMGVVLTAYSPLGTPDSNEMFNRNDPFKLLDDTVLARVAAAHEASPAQILIAWAVMRGTSVIPKSTNEGRIQENLAAQDIALSKYDVAALDELDKPHRFVSGSFWCPEGSPYTLEGLWS